MNRDLWIKWLLQLAGGFMCLAFLAVFMPSSWMAWAHDQMAIGRFPHAPLTQYLTRSTSALYGIHGVLLIALARDVSSHRFVINVIAFLNVLFGILIIGIDFVSGLPLVWTLLEGPPVIGFGALLWWLNRVPSR